MRRPDGLRLLLIAALAAGCAVTGERDAPREAELAANGWIDFAVRDFDVPPDPFVQMADGTVQPPSCQLTVTLDGRPVFSQMLEPRGARPPYRVESGFRIAVPPGDYGAAIIYSGCRSHERGLDSVEVELQIAVRRHQVTRIRFDGARLEAEFPSGALPESRVR
jgi:hypothetical protein